MRLSPFDVASAGLTSGGSVALAAVVSRCSAKPKRLVALAAALSMGMGVHGQPVSGARTLSVQPYAAISQTFSDNIQQTGVDPVSDGLTRLTAGVALRGQTGRVRGTLDYSLSSLVYARHSDLNTFQNSLNAVLGGELIEGRVRLDVTGNIAQSAISAYGVQPGASSGVQSNSTEVRSLRITPSFLGPLGPDLRYAGQLGYAVSSARATALGNSTDTSAGLHIEPTRRGQVSWGLDGSVLRTDYKAGRTTSDDRLYGSATLNLPDWDVRLQGNAGLEFSDITAANRQRYTTWGVGLTWVPSTRTKLSADYGHRFYGPSHSLAFEHRTALTVWRASSSRSVSTTGDQNASGSRGTAYDLLYAQFATAVPDPAARAIYVSNFLKSYGIEPLATPGFLRSSVTLQDRQELSAAMRGARSAAVLSLIQTLTQRLGAASGAADDLANAAEVRQRGFTLDLSHRLAPESTLSLLLTHTRGSGTGSGVSQSSQQRRASLQYRTRPTQHSDLTLGLRRGLYDNLPIGFDESAIFATYGLRF